MSSKLDTAMAQIWELSYWEFKMTIKNILTTQKEKVHRKYIYIYIYSYE